jgi:hypothetical protein
VTCARRVITAAVAFGLLALAIIFATSALRDARQRQRDTQELSRMMTVHVIVGSALSEYYKTNGSYPKLLEEIPAGLFHWGDEASSPADLKLLRYESSSNTFTLLWQRGTDIQLVVRGHSGNLDWNADESSEPLR